MNIRSLLKCFWSWHRRPIYNARAFKELLVNGAGRALLAEHLERLSKEACINNPAPKECLVEVNRILSCAWADNRLINASLAIAAGDKLPPLDLVSIAVNGQTFYCVADGNHRAEAARAAGLSSIRAKIVRSLKFDEKAICWGERKGKLFHHVEGRSFLDEHEPSDRFVKFSTAIGCGPSRTILEQLCKNR